jgi:branched-subunit amino acid transport protein
MSTASAVAAVLVVGVVTYAARGGPILFLADRTLPAPAQRALRHVAPAVLSALVISLTAGGEGLDGFEVAEVAALVVGGAVTWATRKLPIGLAAGMATLWIMLALT